MISYRVDAQTSVERDSFIIGFFMASSADDAITKAIDSLQMKGYLVSEKILQAHQMGG